MAEQIAVEAQKLVANTGVIIQTAVGGSQKSFHLRKMKAEGCHILVGTPGRLNDILSDPYSMVRAPNLSAFVLDEADRLLDQGFAPDIAEIQRLLPKRSEVDRQTLLFSATVPQEVMQIVRETMKSDFKFVRTVKAGEQQTHERVPQKIVEAVGFENFMPAILELCQREIARKDAEQPFKAIVYFNATAEVTLASTIFRNLTNPGVSQFKQHPLHPAQIIEMHARLTQNERTRAAESFRRAKSAIMFSSDVTARGMDFPNVSHVIQVGIPALKDTYIHRIGRTARGDKKGEGWLITSPLEAREVRSRLQDLPITKDQTLETATVDMTKDAQLPEYVAKLLTQVANATKGVPIVIKAKAYLATLGTYQWLSRKQLLVNFLNQRSKFGWGLETPPSIPSGLAHKMGLSKLDGVMISEGNRAIGGLGGRSLGSSGFGRDRGDSSSGGFSRGGYSRGDASGGGFNRGESSRGGFGGGRGRGAYGDREGGSFSSRPERSQGSYGSERSQGSYGRGRDQDRDRSFGQRDRSSGGGGSSYGEGREQRFGKTAY